MAHFRSRCARPRTRLLALLSTAGLLMVLLATSPSHSQAAPPSTGPGSGVVRPVPGPVVAPFDPPRTPYGPGHRGVDLAASPGQAVRAALAGTVHHAGPVGGVGWVTVDHGGGLLTTYGDLVPAGPGAAARWPSRGDLILAGQVLGRLAPAVTHLDWGARLDGRYMDPMGLLLGWRLHLAAPADVPRGRLLPVPP